MPHTKLSQFSRLEVADEITEYRLYLAEDCFGVLCPEQAWQCTRYSHWVRSGCQVVATEQSRHSHVSASTELMSAASAFWNAPGQSCQFSPFWCCTCCFFLAPPRVCMSVRSNKRTWDMFATGLVLHVKVSSDLCLEHKSVEDECCIVMAWELSPAG